MEKNDVDRLARIAQLFLSGDDFERVLIDQRLHTDYRFDEFNRLKSTLSKVERIEPDADVTAILWRLYPGNPYVAEPLVAGNALPNTGWRRVPSTPEQRRACLNGEDTVKTWREGGVSHYYPLRNSDWEIVGFLELLTDRGFHKDVGTTEMFVEKLDIDEDDA